MLNRFLQRLLDVALRVFSLVYRRKLGMSLWKRLPLSVLQNLAIVADDPVPACPRPAPAPSPPPDQAKPTSASAPIARAPSSAPKSVNNNSAKKKW